MQRFLLISANRKSTFCVLIFTLFVPFFLYSQSVTTPQTLTLACVSNMATSSPLCKGKELQLPIPLAFNSNLETYYTVKGELEESKFSNEAILVCDPPDFSLTNISAICGSANLKNVLSLPSVNAQGYSITSWKWILNGTTLLSSSSSGGGGAGNCLIKDGEGADYKVYQRETTFSYHGVAADISALNITVSDFNNTWFTGIIDPVGNCDHSIVLPADVITFQGTHHNISVTAVKWYEVSAVSAIEQEYPVNAAYGNYIFPLGYNHCATTELSPVIPVPTNAFFQAGWVYADASGKLTKIAYCGETSTSLWYSHTYTDLTLIDLLCSSGGSGGGSADPLTLPDRIVTYNDNGKKLVLEVETECGVTRDTITLEIHPVPAVSINNNPVCGSETITFTFTGTPPFTLEYTIDKQGAGAGINVVPTTYGFPLHFSNGSNVDNWTSLGNNIYTCTVTPNTQGKYIFHVTKIRDGNNCEN